MQSLRQPQTRPHPDERAEQAARDENIAPRRYGQHQLTETRRQDRHGEEHHEHERHDARHSAPRILIAHRGAHHSHARGRDAVQATPGEQHLKAARKPAGQSSYHVQRETAEQYRSPPEPIREHPPEKLPNAETRHVGRHDPLAVIRIGHPERPYDRGQRRQHAVDSERLGRLHRRRERDELDKTYGTAGRGSPSDGTESLKF